jgi:shikimate kinase
LENVYLIGLMGAGKTTIGRSLARHLGWDFVDTDREVESRTGVNIPTIFEIEGEEGFRRRESLVVAETSEKTGLVVATGGGGVLCEQNRKHMRTGGCVVYLNVSPRILWERTCRDKNRPLLQVADPLSKLSQLFDARDPLYRETADIVVNGERMNVQDILQYLEKELSARWKS